MNKIINFWKVVFPAQKVFSVLAVVALVLMPLAQGQLVFAIAPPNATSVDITSISPMTNDCVVVGTEITVSGTATADAPPGKLDQYHVQIDWGDGNTDDETEASAFGAHVDGVATRSFSGTHTYTATGTIELSARIYHMTPPGSDGDAAAFEVQDVCIIVDPELQSTLTLVKSVTTDDGGTAVAGDWTLSADGSTPLSGLSGESEVTAVTVTPGTYDLSESGGPSGYVASDWVCVGGTQDDADTVTIAEGEDVTCTITNDDQPGTLIVQKVVTNDNGGTAVASDFSFQVNEGEPNPFESGGEDVVAIDAGTYTVTEVAAAGYTASYENCGQVSVGNGATTTCVITNDDNPPGTGTLIVQKVVINDDGGTATADDFSFQYNGTSTVAFEADGQNDLVLALGLYTITEVEAAGYTTTYEGCDQITIGTEPVTCIITNDDEAPTTSSISGMKWNDVNGNGDNDDESGLGGWVINLWADESLVASTTTDGSGNYSFTGLDPNLDYWVCEEMQSGWNQTSPTLLSDGTVNCPEGTVGYSAQSGEEPETFSLKDFGNQQELQVCELDVVSDGTSIVVETGLNATSTFQHAAWTALIPGATWIWKAFHVENPTQEEIYNFEKTFTWSGPVITAVLDVASDNSYKIWVNGTLAGEDATENNFQVGTQDQYDVTSLIVPGTNTVRIEVKNWTGSENPEANPAGALWKLSLTGEQEGCENPPSSDRFTLTVAANGSGEGVVEGTGIHCDSNDSGSDCSETYPEGTVVTLTATPDSGSNFDDTWTVGAGTCVNNATPCEVTINSDISLNAHFALNSTQQTSGGGGGGGGGGSNNNDDGQVLGASDTPGEVLGEQIAQIPVGAPNTGAGGTASGGLYGTFLTLIGLYGFARSRKSKV